MGSTKYFLLILSFIVFLNTDSLGQIQKDSLTYNISYFGNNFWNEGIKLGIEAPLNSRLKINKKGKARTIVKSHSASFQYYQDNGSHSAIFITAGWSKKKIFNNRFNFTTSAEPIGIYRSFLTETYKVKDDGSIKKSFLPGRFYLAPSVSAGIGRIGKKHPKNGWYARLNLTTLMPYNRSIMPIINCELGYHFTLNNKSK